MSSPCWSRCTIRAPARRCSCRSEFERKRYGVRALGFLDGRLADHTAPVLGGPTDTAFDDVRTGAILRSVAEAAGADVLDFRHLRTPVGDRRNPLVNSRAKPASYATHSLKLDGTWQAFCEERLSKNYRADNRRNWRRLREQGTPRIVIAGSVEQALAILESTFTQKARRYYATGRLNLFAIDAYLEFYRRMTTRHHPSGLVHVAPPWSWMNRRSQLIGAVSTTVASFT